MIKEIEGCTGYFATNEGVIIGKKGYPLKQWLSRGMAICHIISDKSTCGSGPRSVANIIATAFIPNPNGYRWARHKDGNPMNNSVDNLYWACYGEEEDILQNTYHAGLSSANRKRKRVKCLESGEIFKSAQEIADILEVSKSTIFANCQGKLKSAYGFHFEYVD